MFDGLKKRNGDSVRNENYSTDSQVISHIQDDASPVILPGELSLEEDTSGGLGRHLGLFSTTFLMYVSSFVDIFFCLKDICSPLRSIGRIIGTGIFSTPAVVASGVGSTGAALILWVLGLLLSFAGLCVWLEFGCMFPRSGGEKVYLEAVYTRPRYLATILFSVQAVLLGFTGMPQPLSED